MFFSIFKRTETDEQRVIRFADIMVSHADYFGKLNKDCLSPMATFDQAVMPVGLLSIRQELISLQPIVDGDLEPYKKWMSKNFDDLKHHLLSNGYIDNPKPDTQEWVLNEIGKKMKQLKGHKKYQEYIDKKLKAEISEMNGKIYWLRRVIIAAIVAAFVGYFLRYLTEPKEKISKSQASTEKKSQTTLAQPVLKNDTTRH